MGSEMCIRDSAKGDLNTVLLTVTVTDTSAQRSLDIAQSISKQFVTMVSALETPPDSTVPAVTLEVTSAASLNPQPVAPRPFINLGLSFVVGLAIGFAVAVMRDVLDTTVRTKAALQELTGHSILAIVPFDATTHWNSLIVGSSPGRSVRSEAFRQLRTNLQFVDVDNPVKVVVVTSATPAEGKSSTSVNLALTFADADKNVLLIEGDLRHPKIAEYLGLEGSLGLTNALAGQVGVHEVLQSWGHGRLTVLTSGSVPPNPSELLASQNMRDLLEEMKRAYDIIIIDTPPLLPVTDAAIMAANSAGAILIVRHGKTTRAQVTAAVSALNAVDARILGSVLNMMPTKGAEAYGYAGYAHYYGSDAMPGSVTSARPTADHVHEKPDALIDVPPVSTVQPGGSSWP